METLKRSLATAEPQSPVLWRKDCTCDRTEVGAEDLLRDAASEDELDDKTPVPQHASWNDSIAGLPSGKLMVVWGPLYCLDACSSWRIEVSTELRYGSVHSNHTSHAWPRTIASVLSNG